MRSAAVIVAVAIALAVPTTACAPEPRAPPKFPVRRADELLVRRVQAAYDAVRRSGRFWPGFDKTEVKAMLIYDARGEWFFGQSEDLRGFYRTGQTMNGLPINYAEPSLFLTTGVTPYAQIKTRGGWMGRIGWRDFDADTRSRRSEPMMIMQELGVALVNHPRIESTEDWIGVYVHECFHVFQHGFSDARNAGRIPLSEVDDRNVLESLAQAGEYRRALVAEFVMLNGAVTEATTKDSARRTLKRWLTARDDRVRRFASTFELAGGKGDLDRIDMAIMSAEGTAQYVEQRYRGTPAAFADPALVTDPQSWQYAPLVTTMARAGVAIDHSITYRTVGSYFYTLGDLVCRLLDIADEDWKRRAFDRRRLLLAAVEAAVE